MGNTNETHANYLKELVNIKAIWSKGRVKESQALFINKSII